MGDAAAEIIISLGNPEKNPSKRVADVRILFGILAFRSGILREYTVNISFSC